MKILICLEFSMVVSAANSDNWGDYFELERRTLYQRNIELKPNEPIRANTSFTKLHIFQATGSIGVKTFSLLSEITDLTITRSNITHIEDGAICTLPKLESIEIEENGEFPAITESLMSNCDKIKSLVIGNVQIEPSAFKSMTNLYMIWIKSADISHLTKEYLEPLNNLRSLLLWELKIDQIDAGALCPTPNVVDLFISFCTLPSILKKSFFENCSGVKSFQLVSNQMANIEEHAFDGLTNIRSMRMNNVGNKYLTKGHLAGLTSIKALDIDHSNIADIDEDAFEGFHELNSLVLKHNKLSEIKVDLLTHLPKLKELDISGNKLTNIDGLKHPNLVLLDVRNNQIPKINVDLLKRDMPKLKLLQSFFNLLSPENENYIRQELSEPVAMEEIGLQ